MQIPALAVMESFAHGGVTEISGIAIPKGLIPQTDDFMAFVERSRAYVEQAEAVGPQWWKGAPPDIGNDPRSQELTAALNRWQREISEFSDWIAQEIRQEEEDLCSPDLRAALDLGILEIKGHLDYELEQQADSPIGLLTSDEVEEYSLNGAVKMMQQIAGGGSAIMLDEWSEDLSSSLGLNKSDMRLLDTASFLGVSILSRFPRVQNASIEELIDLREDLAGPLVRLRAALVTSSRQAQAEIRQENLDEIIRTIFVEEIEPSLLEIEEARRDNSYIQNLLSSVKDPRQAVAPGLSLAVSIGLDKPILAAVATAIGCSGPQLQAVWGMLQEDKRIQKMKFYFLHRMNE